MPCFSPATAADDPYVVCPVFENTRYRLRLVDMDDAADLLAVYSDPMVWPILNADNCNTDFQFTTLLEMQAYIHCWLDEYQKQYYVRFSIIDLTVQKVVGTIELFRREAADFFNDCGLLRLDLRQDHENEATIHEILRLLLPQAFALFHCRMIATKVPPIARERQRVMEALGFTKSNEMLIGGHDGKRYGDYFVLYKS